MAAMFIEKKEKKRDKFLKKQNTIDNIHNNKINNFLDEISSIDNLEKEKKEIEKVIENLKPNIELTDTELEDKLILIDNKKELEEKIEKIKNGKECNMYLLNTSEVVYDYYHNNHTNQFSVIDLFNKKIEKKTSINDYMHYIDTSNYKKTEYNDNKTIFICNKCNNERIFEENNGNLICPKCGIIEKILTELDKPSFKDPPREISYFAYKRINHFNEWLSQFQAKETTYIPQDVYNLINLELKKESYLDFSMLSASKIREILKKLKLNKYYEHIPNILHKLTGIPAPKIDRQTEEKLRIMFKDIQNPWQKFCPDNRSNFLSYSYVFYKFLQLLEKDEFLEFFSLLKSREKLAEQDKMWRNICIELKWEFIKTI